MRLKLIKKFLAIGVLFFVSGTFGADLKLIAQDNSEFAVDPSEITTLRKMLPYIGVMLDDMNFSFGCLPLPVSTTTLSAIIHALKQNGFHGIAKFSEDKLPEVIRELHLLDADKLILNILQYFPYDNLNREVVKPLGFLYPNEGEPIKINAELDALYKTGYVLREGAYVGVGSERGLCSAWMFRAFLIYLIDHNPHVVVYNNINIGLLAISTSAHDYRYLRLFASPDVWRQRSEVALTSLKGKYVASYVMLVGKPEMWFAWYNWARNIYPVNDKPETGFGLQKLHENDSQFFKDVNYLYDENRFAYLHERALGGRIRADLIDLKNSRDLEKLFTKIKDLSLVITVFDLSNAWLEKYLSQEELHQIDELARKYGLISQELSSLFLVTHNDGQEDKLKWEYLLLPAKSHSKITLDIGTIALKFKFKNLAYNSFW